LFGRSRTRSNVELLVRRAFATDVERDDSSILLPSVHEVPSEQQDATDALPADTQQGQENSTTTSSSSSDNGTAVVTEALNQSEMLEEWRAQQQLDLDDLLFQKQKAVGLAYRGWCNLQASQYFARWSDGSAMHALACEATMLLRVLLSNAEWRQHLMPRFEAALRQAETIEQLLDGNSSNSSSSSSSMSGELQRTLAPMLGALNVLGGCIDGMRVGARVRSADNTYFVVSLLQDDKQVEIVKASNIALAEASLVSASTLHIKQEVRQMLQQQVGRIRLPDSD
jgi:hypothetical protein